MVWPELWLLQMLVRSVIGLKPGVLILQTLGERPRYRVRLGGIKMQAASLKL
jgi:hypothetical protein